jgi:hypothetical protein
MADRPSAPAEFEAVAAYIAQHAVTQCPPTGRGETLPFTRTSMAAIIKQQFAVRAGQGATAQLGGIRNVRR